MSTDRIYIGGRGKTTRNNVEALLGDTLDYRDGEGSDTTVSLLAFSEISEGMIWAAQLAAARGFAVEVIRDVPTIGIPQAILDVTETVLESLPPKRKSDALMILWDDEDEECKVLMAVAQLREWPVFDLTNGLLRVISANTEPLTVAPKPVIPEAEQLIVGTDGLLVVGVDQDLETDADLEEDAEEAEDDEEFLDSAEIILQGIEEIARVFAVAFAEEMRKVLKDEPSE